MIKRIKSDRIITGEQLCSGYVYMEGSKITAVTDAELPFDAEYDRTGFYVAPGFIDMHTHGGAGHEFFGSAEDLVAGCNFHLSHGTTSICPTISAAPFEIMEKSVAEAKKAINDPNLKANIIGLHMEGPYLSAKQCGAQCPDFITPPISGQYEKLIEEAGDVIARWTYAPENDANGVFCKFLREHGIVASAGHTDAKYEDMKLAAENGCNLVTHLYSCTSTITREFGFRKLGVIESVYLNDDMYAEIIADGRHLPPELIRLILKIKGTDRVALCTDSLALAGTDVKEGITLNVPFIIEDGVCKLKDRSAFAGSIATTDVLVRVMTKEVGISVETAVKMLTTVPAEIMGLTNKGMLASGMDADIVVFDENIVMKDVLVAGERIALDALMGHQNEAEEKILIGIDGGGTKTEFVLFTESGNVIRRICLGQSNPSNIGFEQCFSVLSEGIDQLLDYAPRVVSIFAGLAGALNLANAEKMRAYLKSHYQDIHTAVESDALNLFYSGNGGEKGMTLICGTGSILMVHDEGRQYRFGGWGSMFEDVGSAYNIGCDAVKAILRENDGVGQKTILSELVKASFGGMGMAESVHLCYQRGKSFVASLAPIVFAAHKKGDKVATDILQKNADGLAALIRSACQRHGNMRELTVGGGVFDHNRDVFEKMIQKTIDEPLVFVYPKLPPVYGACVACCRMEGVRVTDEFFRNFSKSYHEQCDAFRSE